MSKTKKIFIIFIVLFFISEGIFLAYYFTYNKSGTKDPAALNNNAGTVKPPSKPVSTENQNDSNEDIDSDSSPEEKLTVINKGKLQLVQRNPSDLEATLASRIPLNDKIVRFISDNSYQDIDVSQTEKVSVDNTSYEFNILAKKGKFIDSANTSYLLQLQIPARGNVKSVFKWFLFDTNLQLMCKLNLKEKGLDLPGKIIETIDYDSDARDEILVETTKYLNPENYSSPRYLFKVLNEKQIRLVWREESVNNDRDNGKCSSSTKIVYDQSNPPPPNDPELMSTKKTYTSKLTPGLPQDANSTNQGYSNQSNVIPVISNSVVYEEIREYPDRQQTFQKILDVYVYTWNIDKLEFVYTKKESRNLDVNLD